MIALLFYLNFISDTPFIINSWACCNRDLKINVEEIARQEFISFMLDWGLVMEAGRIRSFPGQLQETK